MKHVLVTLMFVCLVICGYSQNKEKSVRDYMPTDNLQMKKDDNKASNKPNRKKIAIIYVPDSNKILYGNPCATEATHKMGFEYVVEPRNGLESKTSFGKFLNNLLVKSKLVVTRSPFWKLSLNKKLKQCRSQSGDFVG